MSTPILQKRISELAAKRIEVEQKEGLLNEEDKLFAAKKAQRRAFIEQSLQEVAEKLTDDMICKMESKTFIRGAYYLTTELLTRAYHQGVSSLFYRSSEIMVWLEQCYCGRQQLEPLHELSLHLLTAI